MVSDMQEHLLILELILLFMILNSRVFKRDLIEGAIAPSQIEETETQEDTIEDI